MCVNFRNSFRFGLWENGTAAAAAADGFPHNHFSIHFTSTKMFEFSSVCIRFWRDDGIVGPGNIYIITIRLFITYLVLEKKKTKIYIFFSLRSLFEDDSIKL